ncbi:DUF2515 domain-containing protein [Bacillus timonensis]|nr:DUF2515 domain-containing protein [Bacillus timonensis]
MQFMKNLFNQLKNFLVDEDISEEKQLLISKSDYIDLEKMLFDALSTKQKKPLTLIGREKNIVQEIRKKTNELNKNNVTRTNAYLNFYNLHPEIHWSFLAHMVSRNGGWSMTDIRGEIHKDLIPKNKHSLFFLFLEKCNAFIFNDAYPQLLLYEYSKFEKKSFFHLLAHFNVSSFMKPIWSFSYKNQNFKLITTALIINEQNYIEKNVLQDLTFKKEIFQSIEFSLQQLFGFTNVIFPYHTNKNNIRLIGTEVTNFTSLEDRINIGKKLYCILFNKKNLNKVLEFANTQPHTGSRADFWPSIFSKEENLQSTKFIYSPTLQNAWNDKQHIFPQKNDWFVDMRVTHFLKFLPSPSNYKITEKYLLDLIKLTALDLSYDHILKKHFS